jgi:hypothetical protein
METHTSDLTSSCLRRQWLTLQGKAYRETTEALLMGSIAGDCAAIIMEEDLWDASKAEGVVLRAKDGVVRRAAEEHTPLSDAVKRKLPSLIGEVVGEVRHFQHRVKQWLDTEGGYEWVGAEVPVRTSFPYAINGEAFKVQFASHLDLVFWMGDTLVVWDCKRRKSTGYPTPGYLRRNMQFAAYYMAVHDGIVQVDGDWMQLNVYPHMAWFDWASLKPYTKSGKGYKKGEHRPWERVCNWIEHQPENVEAIKREMALRTYLLDKGLAPTNPDPVGCQICPCWRDCPDFTYVPEGIE